jgi:hypothetical protein
MYKFNPQHIADLSGGKVVLAHTKKEEDLPLLMAVFKAAAINKDRASSGKYWLYFRSNGVYYGADWHTELPEELKFNLPIIHLHDFLAKDELPKEDLDRTDLMDKRLKELSERCDLLELSYGFKSVDKIISRFQSPEIAEPKEELLVRIREEQFGDYYYIQVSNKATGFTKDQADQTADLIRWVLNNQDKVIKLKNQ